MGRFKESAPEAPHDDGCRCRKTSVESVLTTPAGIDPDWRERIDLAKRAYQDGKKLREGKPILFLTSRPLRVDYGPYADEHRCRCRKSPALVDQTTGFA